MCVLDVTAAPGSKTSQIAALLQNTWEVIACEKHQIRYDKLLHNLKLQGCTNAITHKMEAEKLESKYKPWYFDAILLDAPCSAEGRIYEPNEKSYGFWTLDNITRNSTMQWDIIESVLWLLRRGGTFVYSTCTLAPEENEAHIARIMKRFPWEFRLEKVWIDSLYAREGITGFEWKEYGDEMKNTLRILPSAESEGFFISKIKKI
jgi:16S rRNA (cytosine1407-C5)-methyltransferase